MRAARLTRSYFSSLPRAPLLIALWSAAIAENPNRNVKITLAAPVVVAVVAWWAILQPHRWLLLFFACLLLTPPVPFSIGNAGLHAAPAFALLGAFVGTLRLAEWRRDAPPVLLATGAFLMLLTGSAGAAMLYSGAAAGLGSLLRVALFGIGVYVLAFAVCGPRDPDRDPLRMVNFLFALAVCAALFGCADYYFQLPAPAGYGAQFVWLDEGVFRRAQGLFYEASTLGNFCAFFLIMTIVSLFREREHAPCSRLLLIVGALVFSTTLILSYSRASVLNVLVAGCALAWLRRRRAGQGTLRMRKLAMGAGAVILVAAAAGLAVRYALPSFSASYWSRMSGSIQYLFYSPDGVLSGRVTNWATIVDFLRKQPLTAIFGIGYKTLPYSNLLGQSVIADNTYLSLLAETGFVGLAMFLLLNGTILRAGFRAARSSRPRASFLGEWIFCFWAGEMVQMLSGDLITYWRVLPVYFWVLGTAVRETGADE